MELLIKAAAVGVMGSLLALVVKRTNPETGLLLALAVCLPVTALALTMMGALVDFAAEAAEAANVSPAVLSPMLKCVGLGIVTKLSADLCKDAGQGAVASAVELAGTAAALYVSLPLLKTFFQMIEGLT